MTLEQLQAIADKLAAALEPFARGADESRQRWYTDREVGGEMRELGVPDDAEGQAIITQGQLNAAERALEDYARGGSSSSADRNHGSAAAAEGTNVDASPAGERWRHHFRGTDYTIRAKGILQTAQPLEDGTILLGYEGDDGQWWFRTPEEFYSRFAKLKAAVAQSAEHRASNADVAGSTPAGRSRTQEGDSPQLSGEQSQTGASSASEGSAQPGARQDNALEFRRRHREMWEDFNRRRHGVRRVPVEPTEDMIGAAATLALARIKNPDANKGFEASIREMWGAMVEAAPQVHVQGRDDVVALLREARADIAWLGGQAGSPRAELLKRIDAALACHAQYSSEPDAWLILFEDSQKPPEVFMGHGAGEAARKRFAEVSTNWNATLFASVGSNFPAIGRETPLHVLQAAASARHTRGLDGFMVDGVKWVREDSVRATPSMSSLEREQIIEDWRREHGGNSNPPPELLGLTRPAPPPSPPKPATCGVCGRPLHPTPSP